MVGGYHCLSSEYYNFEIKGLSGKGTGKGITVLDTSMYNKANNNRSTTKNQKHSNSLLLASGTFPYGVVTVTAGRGTVGSQPGRAGAMIPSQLQGMMWRSAAFPHVVMADRLDGEMGCSRNLGVAVEMAESSTPPGVANKCDRKLRGCWTWSAGLECSKKA